jgi:hypothetical protein
MLHVELEDMELCILLDPHVHPLVVAHNDVVQVNNVSSFLAQFFLKRKIYSC